MTTKYALEISNLSKTYTKSTHKALDNLNLNIRKGSIFGLLGPNGSGKSTLINIISGIVKKDNGTIKSFDYDLDIDHKKLKTIIGVVPQEVIIDNFFSIKTLLELTAGYYGITTDKNIDNILTILGLYDKRYSLGRSLSGGMKRRVLIAKAMIHSPKILILDEPTAGVDVELREQLHNYIKLLNQQGTTIILTTHYLEEAENLCDEIAFINKGKIIIQDLKQNLLSNLGAKQLLVEFSSCPDYNQITLLQNNNFEIISLNSCKIIIKNKDNLNNLLEFVLKLNLPIKNLTVSQYNIEDIFKQLIKKSE